MLHSNKLFTPPEFNFHSAGESGSRPNPTNPFDNTLPTTFQGVAPSTLPILSSLESTGQGEQILSFAKKLADKAFTVTKSSGNAKNQELFTDTFVNAYGAIAAQHAVSEVPFVALTGIIASSLTELIKKALNAQSSSFELHPTHSYPLTTDWTTKNLTKTVTGRFAFYRHKRWSFSLDGNFTKSIIDFHEFFHYLMDSSLPTFASEVDMTKKSSFVGISDPVSKLVHDKSHAFYAPKSDQGTQPIAALASVTLSPPAEAAGHDQVKIEPTPIKLQPTSVVKTELPFTPSPPRVKAAAQTTNAIQQARVSSTPDAIGANVEATSAPVSASPSFAANNIDVDLQALIIQQAYSQDMIKTLREGHIALISDPTAFQKQSEAITMVTRTLLDIERKVAALQSSIAAPLTRPTEPTNLQRIRPKDMVSEDDSSVAAPPTDGGRPSTSAGQVPEAKADEQVPTANEEVPKNEFPPSRRRNEIPGFTADSVITRRMKDSAKTAARALLKFPFYVLFQAADGVRALGKETVKALSGAHADAIVSKAIAEATECIQDGYIKEAITTLANVGLLEPDTWAENIDLADGAERPADVDRHFFNPISFACKEEEVPKELQGDVAIFKDRLKDLRTAVNAFMVIALMDYGLAAPLVGELTTVIDRMTKRFLRDLPRRLEAVHSIAADEEAVAELDQHVLDLLDEAFWIMGEGDCADLVAQLPDCLKKEAENLHQLGVDAHQQMEQDFPHMRGANHWGYRRYCIFRRSLGAPSAQQPVLAAPAEAPVVAPTEAPAVVPTEVSAQGGDAAQPVSSDEDQDRAQAQQVSPATQQPQEEDENNEVMSEGLATAESADVHGSNAAITNVQFEFEFNEESRAVEDCQLELVSLVPQRITPFTRAQQLGITAAEYEAALNDLGPANIDGILARVWQWLGKKLDDVKPDELQYRCVPWLAMQIAAKLVTPRAEVKSQLLGSIRALRFESNKRLDATAHHTYAYHVGELWSARQMGLITTEEFSDSASAPLRQVDVEDMLLANRDARVLVTTRQGGQDKVSEMPRVYKGKFTEPGLLLGHAARMHEAYKVHCVNVGPAKVEKAGVRYVQPVQIIRGSGDSVEQGSDDALKALEEAAPFPVLSLNASNQKKISKYVDYKKLMGEEKYRAACREYMEFNELEPKTTWSDLYRTGLLKHLEKAWKAMEEAATKEKKEKEKKLTGAAKAASDALKGKTHSVVIVDEEGKAIANRALVFNLEEGMCVGSVETSVDAVMSGTVEKVHHTVTLDSGTTIPIIKPSTAEQRRIGPYFDIKVRMQTADGKTSMLEKGCLIAFGVRSAAGDGFKFNAIMPAFVGAESFHEVLPIVGHETVKGVSRARLCGQSEWIKASPGEDSRVRLTLQDVFPEAPEVLLNLNPWLPAQKIIASLPWVAKNLQDQNALHNPSRNLSSVEAVEDIPGVREEGDNRPFRQRMNAMYLSNRELWNCRRLVGCSGPEERI